MEKSTQISTITKYQKNPLSVFAYQLYQLIQFMEKIKTIFKCFYKNINMLLKKKDI